MAFVLPGKITETEFYNLIFVKGKSADSVHSVKTALRTFDKFCLVNHSKSRAELVQDIKSSDAGLKLLMDFKAWLLSNTKKQSHAVGTTRNYISAVRKWLKFVGGIRIDSNDFKDFLVFPSYEREDEEAEPLTHENLRIIIDHFANPKRKALFMFMKSTAARTKEALQIKKGYFDFNAKPVSVIFPRGIVKGKTRKRVQFVDGEAVPMIKLLAKNCSDDDFIFRKNLGITLETERNNIIKNWSDVVTKLGFNERYANGRLKHNIHSIRAFCMTQYEKATKDERLAHAYGGHRAYLDQYLRRSESEKAALFEQAEPYLAINTKFIFSEKVTN